MAKLRVSCAVLVIFVGMTIAQTGKFGFGNNKFGTGNNGGNNNKGGVTPTSPGFISNPKTGGNTGGKNTVTENNNNNNRGFGTGHGFGGLSPGNAINRHGFGGNNQGFGGNNQGFGGNNQGFGGNNQGFGGNNRGFGRNRNGFGRNRHWNGGNNPWNGGNNQWNGGNNQWNGNNNQGNGGNNQGNGGNNQGNGGNNQGRPGAISWSGQDSGHHSSRQDRFRRHHWRPCRCEVKHPQTKFCQADFVIAGTNIQRYQVTPRTHAHRIELGGKIKLTEQSATTLKGGVVRILSRTNTCGVNLQKLEYYILGGRFNNDKAWINKCDFVELKSDLTKAQLSGIYNDYATNCTCEIHNCWNQAECVAKIPKHVCMIDRRLSPDCHDLHGVCAFDDGVCGWVMTEDLVNCTKTQT